MRKFVVDSLIMAGGKGSRLGGIEKGLIELGGITILERELTALKESDCVSKIYVAVSQNTPKTLHFARTKKLEVITTLGRGYVEDSREALGRLSLGVTLVLCSDMPFLTPEIIKRAVSEYYEKGKPALSLAIPKSSVPRSASIHNNNIEHSSLQNNSEVLPAGVNIIDGRLVSGDAMIDEASLVVDEPLGLLNVNTPEELALARRHAEAEGTNSKISSSKQIWMRRS